MTAQPSRSREALVFAAITGLTLVLSMVFVLPRQWHRGFLGPDAAWHADLARHVLADDGYVSSTLFPWTRRRSMRSPWPKR